MSKNSIQIHHRGEFEASNQLQFCAPRTIDDDRSHHPIPRMKRKEGSTKEGRRRRRRRCKFLSAMITPMIRISKEVVTSAQKSYSIHPPNWLRFGLQSCEATHPTLGRSVGRRDSANARGLRASCVARKIEEYTLRGTHTTLISCRSMFQLIPDLNTYISITFFEYLFSKLVLI